MLSALHAKLNGWYAVIATAALPGVIAVLNQASIVNWQTLGLSPTTAVLVSLAIIGARAITNPIGTSK